MITHEHIAALALDNYRLGTCARASQLGLYIKPENQGLITLANAVVSQVMNVDPDDFVTQAEAAREHGVAYLHSLDRNTTVGVSATVSVVKTREVLDKRTIVPASMLQRNRRLAGHYIISAFLRPAAVPESQPAPEPETDTETDAAVKRVSLLLRGRELVVAGWIDTVNFLKHQTDKLPYGFKRGETVTMCAIKCRQLLPIPELIPQMTAATLRL